LLNKICSKKFAQYYSYLQILWLQLQSLLMTIFLHLSKLWWKINYKPRLKATQKVTRHIFHVYSLYIILLHYNWPLKNWFYRPIFTTSRHWQLFQKVPIFSFPDFFTEQKKYCFNSTLFKKKHQNLPLLRSWVPGPLGYLSRLQPGLLGGSWDLIPSSSTIIAN
jgi:hypothetical protein